MRSLSGPPSIQQPGSLAAKWPPLWYDTILRTKVTLGERRAARGGAKPSMNFWSEFEQSESWANCPPDVRELLLTSREIQELTFEQGHRLATASGPALDALITAADTLRREAVGDTITYVVNRNINFTNVCFVGCSF